MSMVIIIFCTLIAVTLSSEYTGDGRYIYNASKEMMNSDPDGM